MKTLLFLFVALAIANAARPAPTTPPLPQPLRILIQSRDGVTPLAAGDTVYYPYGLDRGCTINSLDLVVAPSGTASLDIWMVPNGPGLPTTANSITGTNAPSAITGQHIVMTNFSSWSTLSIPPHAVLAFYVKDATGSPTQIAVGVQCQQ